MFDDCDDLESTTALKEACFHGHLETLKKLKPSPKDDLNVLLRAAAFGAHCDVMNFLLDFGTDPNDKANGGASCLDRCIWYLRFESLRSLLGGRQYKSDYVDVAKTRKAIRLLVERGAVWNPDDRSQMKEARQVFFSVQPYIVVEILGWFVEHRACSEDTMQEFLRSQAMKRHLGRYKEELLELSIDIRSRAERRAEEKAAELERQKEAIWRLRALAGQYDRDKIYEEVWTEPTYQVAKRYGISDVMLTKVCRRLKIPKPGRGYWAKKAAGRPVEKRPPLPRLKLELED